MLLGIVLNVFCGFFLVVYYVLVGLLLLPFCGGLLEVNYRWLAVLVYINIPLGVSFFVKIFVLRVSVSYLFVILLCVMIIMFVCFFSIFSWFMLLSMDMRWEESKNNGLVFVVLGLVFLVLIYHFSKSLLCYFDGIEFGDGILY